MIFALNKHPETVSDESLDGLKVQWCWNCDHVLMGLKTDELQGCRYDSVVDRRVFFLVESEDMAVVEACWSQDLVSPTQAATRMIE